MKEIRVLFVYNKKMPDNDHRLAYSFLSKKCRLTFALPARPESLCSKDHIKIGFGEGLKVLYIKQFFRLFIHLYSNRKTIDLVHFSSTNLVLFGPIVAFIAGVPSIITVTGLGRSFTSQGYVYLFLRVIYLLIFRISILLTKQVLFQNNGHMKWMENKFPNQAWKFSYVGSAVSIRKFDEKDFDSSKLKVLLVARLMPDKGIEDFLSVAEAFINTNFEFVLIGPPSDGYDELFNKVKECHKRGSITYLGELNSKETLSEYEDSQIFFFPSYGEGMARTMLECGYYKLCPIGYRISANEDLLTNNRGFLLNIGDIESAKKVLRELDTNRELLRTNASNYQEWVTDSYNMSVFTQRMDDIYLGAYLSSRSYKKQIVESSTIRE